MAGVFPFRNLAFAVATCCLLSMMGLSVASAIVISFLMFLRMGGMRFFKLLYRTLPRDLRLVDYQDCFPVLLIAVD